MKKTLLTIALMFAASQAFAALSNAGGISNWKAQKDSNGDVVLKTIPSSDGGSGAVSITANLWPKAISFNVYSVLSQTATSVNLTTLAGVSAPLLACLSGNGATSVGAGYFAQFLPSASAPVNLTSTAGTGQAGELIMNDTTSQCWCASPGDVLHMAAKAGSVTAKVSLFKMVTQ